MSEPDANGWMLIETAPKDGTYVLCGAPGHSASVYFWNGHAWDDGDFFSNEMWPTHWMPLSLPPGSPSLPLTPEASTPAGEGHTPPSSPAGTNSEAQP
jgi:hypothetical protein